MSNDNDGCGSFMTSPSGVLLLFGLIFTPVFAPIAALAVSKRWVENVSFGLLVLTAIGASASIMICLSIGLFYLIGYFSFFSVIVFIICLAVGIFEFKTAWYVSMVHKYGR
jgi:hypothetical protein